MDPRLHDKNLEGSVVDEMQSYAGFVRAMPTEIEAFTLRPWSVN